MADRQEIAAGVPFPVYVNETATRQEIATGPLYLNETITSSAVVTVLTFEMGMGRTFLVTQMVGY